MGMHARRDRIAALEAAIRHVADDAAHRQQVFLQALDKHAQDLLDRADAHHLAVIAHVSRTAADGPVRGGAGANPAGEGLTADTAAAVPVVPPPAAAKTSRRTTTAKGM